jgi:hypothetical protein
MSHSLERLLNRLKRPHSIDTIRCEFSHSTIEHALDRKLIALDENTTIAFYTLTEVGLAKVST